MKQLSDLRSTIHNWNKENFKDDNDKTNVCLSVMVRKILLALAIFAVVKLSCDWMMMMTSSAQD